ncbi:unnamed protein product [Linum trigynum]|uniref:Uncharacterized protein n=1 Tax=Linum trigynum TaxID=586398 RepID=A0AAV2EBQ8_9ROSI
MLARRFVSVFKGSQRSLLSSAAKPAEEGKSEASSFGRKAVSFVLITVTGGVALSALDDLSIYYGCTRKAMERANNNEKIKVALGEPIAKGPWYSASLAVSHRRQSVSCSFPVAGPRGNGVVQMKAVRGGDDNWLSYLLPRDWEILIMDALVNIPSNEEKQQTQRISLLDSSSACQPCTACPRTQKPETK